MLTERVAGYLSIALLVLGFGADIALAAVSYVRGGHWPSDWPKELDAWRGCATTFRYAPSQLSGVYTISFEDREAFENGWPALLKVERTRDATLILVSDPVKEFSHEKLKHQPPGRPSVQITCHWRIEKNSVVRRGDVIHRIVLCVDGKIVDLNRIHIPTGFKIEYRRVFSSD